MGFQLQNHLIQIYLEKEIIDQHQERGTMLFSKIHPRLKAPNTKHKEAREIEQINFNIHNIQLLHSSLVVGCVRGALGVWFWAG